MTDKAIICLENKKKTRRFRCLVQIWCHFCVFKYTLLQLSNNELLTPFWQTQKVDTLAVHFWEETVPRIRGRYR